MRGTPSLGVALVLAFAGLGCGDDDAAGATASGASSSSASSGAGGGAGSSGSGGAPGEARVRFFVDERPHDEATGEVEAGEARWGDPIRVVVDGLAPGQDVRIDVSTEAWAVFTADAEGIVDLGRDAPGEGTWSSADVDGIFWSAPPAQAPVFDVEVVVDSSAGDELGRGTIRRRPLNEGVTIERVQEGTLVGVLVRPADAPDELPAVLAFGGSEGGTLSGEYMAYHLAQLGYVAFGVGYFGAEGLPDDLHQVPLEILEGDLAFLAAQPGVDPERIAVLGASRGGELALLLGANYPELVSAVVAQVPSGYVWGAVSGEGAAWTIGGVDVPWVPDGGGDPDYETIDGETYVRLTPAFLENVAAASPEALAAATIDVAATAGPILLSGGADDQLWPSCALGEASWSILQASGHAAEHGDVFECHPDAGHWITFPPGSSTLDSSAYHNPTYDVWFVLGGTPEGIARAERAGNSTLRRFLEDAFAR